MRTSVVFFLLFSFSLCQAQVLVKGRLLNEAHFPIEGATVILKNKVIAVTNADGNYTFQVDNLPVKISFTHTSYTPVKITVVSEDAPETMLITAVPLLQETVVKAFGNNGVSVKNISAAVTVLDKDALLRTGGNSFVTAVNIVPGVKMDERSPGSYRLSIRGNLLRSTFGIRNIKVYWNGIPFTDANGNTYLNEIAVQDIDRIEIIKGPSGSMYGTGTGGVVLLSNDFSATPKKYIQVRTSAASYGTFTTGAAYVQADTKNNTKFSFDHQQSDGYRQQSNMRRDAANFAGKYQVAKNHQLSTTVFYSNLYYATPGALTLAEVHQNPLQARPAAGGFAGAAAQKAAIYLKTLYTGISDEININKQWKNTTGLYFANTEGNNPAIRNFESKTETGTGLRTIFQYKKANITASFGGEYQYAFTNTATYGNRLGKRDTLQYHDKIDARQYNFFVQADIPLPHDIILTAGLSFNNFYYGFNRVSVLPKIKQEGNFDPQLIPRLAASKKIIDGLSVYASFSKGFSPPSIDEIHASDGKFNITLNAETALNYETGIKATLIKNKLWADASYYFFNLRSTIVSRRDNSGADYYVNAGKTKQYGVEAAINYLAVSNEKYFFRQLKFFLSYTNINAHYVQYQQENIKYDGNKMPGTTPNILVAGADAVSAKGIYVALSYSYTGSTALNDANTFFGNNYNLGFAKLGYKIIFHKNIATDIFLAAEKSFNNPYSLGNDLNAAGNRFYNPSAPHTYTVGAKFQFGIK